MTGRFNIIWTISGDSDKNLSYAEVKEILDENQCSWEDSGIIDKETNNRVGYVERQS